SYSVCCLRFRLFVVALFFFFSSRRRHTRSDRDWSSDVCSSDLRRRALLRVFLKPDEKREEGPFGEFTGHYGGLKMPRPTIHLTRSEERRVGKEYRSRRSPSQ